MKLLIPLIDHVFRVALSLNVQLRRVLDLGAHLIYFLLRCQQLTRHGVARNILNFCEEGDISRSRAAPQNFASTVSTSLWTRGW